MDFNFLEKYSTAHAEYINKLLEGFSCSISGNKMRQLIGKELLSFGIHANRFPYQASLEVKPKDNRNTSYVHRMKEGTCVIGRRDSCSIVLSEKIVSAVHAKIVSKQDNYYLVDLKSLNGTQLNGEQILPDREIKIHSGDMISIGSYSLIVDLHVKQEEPLPVRIELKHFDLFSKKAMNRLNHSNYICLLMRMRDARDSLYVLVPKYLCHILAHQMLGIRLNEDIRFTGIGEIEMAFIEYVAMKICALLNKVGIPLTFIKAYDSLCEFIKEVVLDRYYYAEIWTTIDGCTDFLPLILPLINVPANEHFIERKIPFILQSIPVELKIEIGYTTLSYDCIRRIEPGDVVLFDVSFISTREMNPGARAMLKISSDRTGHVDCVLISENGKMFLKLMNFFKGGYGAMDKIMDENIANAGSGDNSAPATDLVENIELMLVCELSRFQMTIGEISKLKQEQIIALNRSISGEVSLSLENKIIGKGYLVDIDGKMGVRIASIEN